MGAICVPRTLQAQTCITINYKIHFIIKQSVLHINLTANFKKNIKNDLKRWKYSNMSPVSNATF